MKVLGIIAEYNPFHNGHLYHLRQCREQSGADFTAVVMSGNFTQRGEPAVLDKWTRSRLAVCCGADLVLELPFAYALGSAEHFAKGGVGILSGLGCVTHLGFGAEEGTLAELDRAAEFLAEESPDYQDRLKGFLNTGISYAKARQKTLEACLGSHISRLCLTPNNILALEYLKQLHLQDESIKPVMVKRKGSGYFDKTPKEEFASAAAIRHYLSVEERKQYVPAEVEAALTDKPEISGYFDLVRSVLLRSSPYELSQLLSVSEGLEYKLKEQVRAAETLEDFVEAVASKRYPKTRIQRILCQALIGLKPFEDVFYARILAVGAEGGKLLRQIKKTTRIPLITNINKLRDRPFLTRYDILASDIYNILTKADLYERSDYVMHPYIQSLK